MKKIAVLGAAAVALYVGTANHGVPVASTHASGTAATAISYAQQQIGKPHLWGGPTAPGTSGGFDCSGLVMMAYQSAGISVPHTSQDQWATEPHVSTPEPGDAVFFAGADGTASAPGHEGIVTGPNQMIEAYATGTDVRYSTFGLSTSPPGDTDPVGFTDPAASGTGA